MSSLTAIGLVGSGFGVCLGSPLLWSAHPREAAHRFLGALLIVSALAAAVITAEHAGYLPAAEWVSHLEYVLTLMVGPILYLYVRGASGHRIRTGEWVHAVPTLTYVGYVLLANIVTAPTLSIRHVLVVQVCYTLAAARTYLGAKWDPARCNRGGLPWAALVLGGFTLIHLAQMVRLSWPGLSSVRESVPLAITAGFLSIGAAGFHRALLAPGVGAGGATRARYARSALRADRVEPRLSALARLMSIERAFTNPDMTLAYVASRLGVPPYQVSQLLNQFLGRTFTAWVNEYRVADAKTQLLDPANDRYTIEAVALDAGFRSRAGFYKAFKRSTGVTPTEFRRRRRLDASPRCDQ